jgi:hypothetical protein
MRSNANGIQPIGASVGGNDQIGIGQLALVGWRVLPIRHDDCLHVRLPTLA